jgi:hypothetical protein
MQKHINPQTSLTNPSLPIHKAALLLIDWLIEQQKEPSNAGDNTAELVNNENAQQSIREKTQIDQTGVF